MDQSELPNLLVDVKRIITPKMIVVPGVVKLTSGGTATFTGTNKRSVSLSVVSRTSGTVTVTADGVTTDVSYQGLNIDWSIDKMSDLKLGALTIIVTGDCICVVTYTL